MLLSPRKNGLTSLFKEVRVFKVGRGVGAGTLLAKPTKMEEVQWSEAAAQKHEGEPKTSTGLGSHNA